MKYPSKLLLFLFSCFLLSDCKKDEKVIRIIEGFDLNLGSKGIIHFDNPECAFDNRQTQSQFNGGAMDLNWQPVGHQLFSNYTNFDSTGNIVNQVWIHLFVDYSNGIKKFSPDYLKGLLKSENSNLNQKHLYPQVDIQICGKRFDNEDHTVTGFKINDNFNYKINDYEVLYASDCVDRKLLFLDITLEGMLYEPPWQSGNDSLHLNAPNLKLLFDIER
jgi:hypothetical protein